MWIYLGERGVGLRELPQAHGEHAGDAKCCDGDERSSLQKVVLPSFGRRKVRRGAQSGYEVHRVGVLYGLLLPTTMGQGRWTLVSYAEWFETVLHGPGRGGRRADFFGGRVTVVMNIVEGGRRGGAGSWTTTGRERRRTIDMVEREPAEIRSAHPHVHLPHQRLGPTDPVSGTTTQFHCPHRRTTRKTAPPATPHNAHHQTTAPAHLV